MGQPAMRRYIAEERAPDPRCTSDAELLAFARATGTTVFHPTSTCRMGSDSTAVVDERLRMHGIERLRVVDGSIMPTVVSGNTNAAIVMIAEKGADVSPKDAVVERRISRSARDRPNPRCDRCTDRTYRGRARHSAFRVTRNSVALDIGCLPKLAFRRVPAARSRNEWETRMDAIPDDSELADTRTPEP